MVGPAPIGRRERWSAAASRGRLFLASYAPLALIFALRSAPHHWVAFAVWLAIGVAGFVDAARLLHGVGRRGRHSVRFSVVADAGGAVAAYLATYLLPFISAPPTTAGDIAAYCVYFMVVFVIYIRSDMAFVNPTLYVLGRRVVDATREDNGRQVLVVCKTPPGERVDVDAADFLEVLVVRD